MRAVARLVRRPRGLPGGARRLLALSALPHPRWLAAAPNALTLLGRGGAVWVAGALGARLLGAPGSGRALRALLLSLLGATVLVEVLLKRLVRRPRPLPGRVRARVLGRRPGPAFPSGDAAAAFAGAWTLGAVWPRWAPAWLALAGALGALRVYLGAHRAGDVAAGALAGVAVAELVRRGPPLARGRWQGSCRLASRAPRGRRPAGDRSSAPAGGGRQRRGAAGGAGEDAMRDRIDRTQLHEGMQVYSGEGQPLGTIERIDADSVTVRGQQYEFASIERVESERVHLTRQVGASTERGGAGAGGRAAEAESEVRVPVREERLEVDKRAAELGAVEVRTRVEEEQQTVPVELEREEVRVRQEAVPARPVAPGERAFEEETIRVPVRGEEAVARKEAVVTGEVVIDKTEATQTEQVAGTVRREVVDVDEDYARHRAAYQQEYAQRAGAAGRPFEEAEPHFRTGYAAARDPRYAGRAFEEVEPELRAGAGAADEGAWERIKAEVREGFDRARGR